MGEITPLHRLILLATIVILFNNRRLSDFFRNFPGGRTPPTHPLPVTSPLETSKPNRSAQKESHTLSSKSRRDERT